MLKYLTHKLKTQSINEENSSEKIDCHDSGTESDGDLDSEDFNERDMELNMSHEEVTTSPDCCSESPAFLSPQTTTNLMYDQHSSEEELEVIMTKPLELDNNLIEMTNENHNNHQSQKSKFTNNGEISPKRCSSEKRKRSLAHNSDDEVRHFLESSYHHNMLAPVNFRTTPPLEALKPNRGHLLLNHQYSNKNLNRNSPQQPPSVQQRSNTPLIGRGIENIRISCDSPLTTGSGSSSTPSSSSLDLRSISPPTKVLAISPRRNRTPRSQLQRLQRRPCLDFDKMQLKARNWNNDGDLSVFCW